MEKVASVATALVLFFPSPVLIFALSTCKIGNFENPAQVDVCTKHNCPNFGMYGHKISTSSSSSTLTFVPLAQL